MTCKKCIYTWGQEPIPEGDVIKVPGFTKEPRKKAASKTKGTQPKVKSVAAENKEYAAMTRGEKMAYTRAKNASQKVYKKA